MWLFAFRYRKFSKQAIDKIQREKNKSRGLTTSGYIWDQPPPYHFKSNGKTREKYFMCVIHPHVDIDTDLTPSQFWLKLDHRPNYKMQNHKPSRR